MRIEGGLGGRYKGNKGTKGELLTHKHSNSQTYNHSIACNSKEESQVDGDKEVADLSTGRCCKNMLGRRRTNDKESRTRREKEGVGMLSRKEKKERKRRQAGNRQHVYIHTHADKYIQNS